MSISVELLPEFGYVILVFIVSYFALFWMAANVGMARKKYEVPYPAMYSDRVPMFNCIQRAHQNTLEAYPPFLVFLLLGGLLYPKLSALSGIVWIVSRIVYAKGYYTGDPKNRNYGAFGYLGLLVLLGCNVCLALQLIGVV